MVEDLRIVILLVIDGRGMVSFVNNFLYELCKKIKLLVFVKLPQTHLLP